MNWLGLAFGLAIVGVMVYLYWYRRRGHSEGGWTYFPVSGLGVIIYSPTDTNRTEVARIIVDLSDALAVVWPGLEAVYGEEIDYYMDTIRLDPSLKQRPVHLHLGPVKMSLNPNGGAGKTARQLFALELHNLYRDFIGRPYRPEPHEMDTWDLGQQECVRGGSP